MTYTWNILQFNKAEIKWLLLFFVWKAKAFPTPIFVLTDKEEKKIEDEVGENNGDG